MKNLNKMYSLGSFTFYYTSRERKIQEIEASFEACKQPPVHAKNSKLEPVEVLPLLPDFARYALSFPVAC